MSGKKYDKDKLDWSILPLKKLEGIVKVLMFGEKRYGRENWKTLKDPRNRYLAALKRHISEFEAGELVDRDSNLLHTDHAMANILFLQYFDSLDE